MCWIENWLTLYVAHQARFLAISNMMFHHNLSTIFGGWVPRTIMAYRHMNFCGFQNHCEPDLRISYYHPLLVYYNTGGFGIWQFPPKKHATYTTKNLVGQFSNIWMNLAPFFIQPPMYIRKKNYSRNLSLVLEMIVENSEFWIPSSTHSSMDFWYLKNSQQNKTVIYHLELGI